MLTLKRDILKIFFVHLKWYFLEATFQNSSSRCKQEDDQFGTGRWCEGLKNRKGPRQSNITLCLQHSQARMNANGREMNITARVWFRGASALIRSKSGVFRNPKRFMVRFSGQFCSEFGLFQSIFNWADCQDHRVGG